MKAVTPAEIQRLIAGEFERRGWAYDLSVGREIAERAVRDGEVDGTKLAATVSATYLEKNGVKRGELAAALGSALAGRTPGPEARSGEIVITIDDHSHSVNVGPGAQVSGSPISTGGTQIVISSDSSREDALAAVAALVRAGLIGDWNDDAARDLSTVVDSRDDVQVQDIQEVVTEVAREEPPNPGRVRDMLDRIAAGGLGGALSTGITSGLGKVLENPPL